MSVPLQVLLLMMIMGTLMITLFSEFYFRLKRATTHLFYEKRVPLQCLHVLFALLARSIFSKRTYLFKCFLFMWPQEFN